MNKYLYLILFIFLLLVVGMFSYQNTQIKKYKSLYYKELTNVEAYQASNSILQNKVKEYSMTINDLKVSKDSIDQKLIKVIKELKIKEKTILYLQYQLSTASKTDTIRLHDTLFKENVNIDTTIKEGNWYKLELGLHYPSQIIVSPTFNSEKYIIVNANKEYDNVPSKIFFIRWFQKKHTVIEVIIEEKNPYINNNNNKFIKILK